MYAVIRAGGKQYRVAPGDVIHIERQPAPQGKIEFADVLATSAAEGQITRPQHDARVFGRVLEEGRGDKVLVFHYKRKKQYKKLAGHRQQFSRVRITEIVFAGHSYKAAESAAPSRPAHAPARPAAHSEPAHHAAGGEHKAHAARHAVKKSDGKGKAAAKKSGSPQGKKKK